MKKSVLVTGISGSGKTTVCAALQKLGHSSIDIEQVSGLYNLVNSETGKAVLGNMEQIDDNVDWVCNKVRINDLINLQQNSTTFYCGGMSNTEEVWGLFDKVNILSVSDKITRYRLSKRKNGEFGSTQKNIEWILSWKHEIEDRWLGMGGILLSAEQDPMKVAKSLVVIADKR